MRFTIFVLGIAAMVGCAGDAPKSPAVKGVVTVDESSATRIAGNYTQGEDTVAFEARVLQPNLLSVKLQLHGMTLDATLDTSNGNRMWSQDAFATTTGQDTVVAEDDITLLATFTKALEAANLGISQGDGLAFHMGAVINLWSQWIPAMNPIRIKFEDRDRATDMCWWASAPDRYHSYEGHDCDSCSGDPMQGQGFSSCSSYGAYGPYYGDTTWYYYNGGWQTSSDGHGNGSYITGDCFGRYGAGCGSGNAYFQENASHDHCVRNAHSIISAWCSDELWNTTDPYNCW
jgi:hypothetical protein